MNRAPAQPYRFRLVMKDGATVEGGAESRELCIDHVRACLRSSRSDSNPVAEGYYLGKYAQNAKPQRIDP